MEELLAYLAVAAAAGWGTAGAVAGLWWGERGRRVATEMLAMHGTPLAPVATVLTPREDADELAAAAVRQAEVERIFDHLVDQAQLQGIPFSVTALRQEAETMAAQFA